MFYKLEVKDHIRVPPDTFNLPLEEAVVKRIKKKYDGFISKDLGIVIDVSGVKEIGEGIIIPGDGASYYEAVFILLTFKPEMQEVVLGKVRDIAEFGAFMNLGPIEGMIHISQTMDDFVSFSKDKHLTGKESKRVLKVGDVCRARIIAISFSDPLNPKLGLTMRQQGLGKLEWVKEDQSKKAPAEEEKPTKEKKK
ncbi:TPA: DNA-directed RNA polymerase [Candidatus Woesearchaeota archaeon]|nr:DNA-directed RNA polymerase [Candidatus Woesearchaeota archaeon]HIH05146.1 DNA-directed RNA polymerase [Candidatus Woesearchaeota archaeon]HIH91928.1 DNA-directed RNA polymerase [Candidatus Woesearchaeota archaeon]HII63948.1 DNA-directed RNA polymerase [Candidatus Woesearchaeota archaeon]HII65858.1 DNA-directed RNA polymerase [Candidatus Woesearchaeota archaeon]